MARLPSEKWLIQQVGSEVILFEDFTEREIGRFDPSDPEAAAKFQKTIYDSELDDQDKCFAHFWCGYFYAFGTGATRPMTVRTVENFDDFLKGL
jgi:hypothetical protein